ncbi:MAG: flagellar hook-basal body complex protein [Nitrospinota bacterium]|nr:flagellar hook-basal body complex protein [Nitrospinota bacterium]
MLNVLSNALSGLKTFSRKLQAGANNVANVSTSGFKASRVDTTSIRSGGVTAITSSRTNTQGSIETTGNALDLAISGKGFFQLGLADGGTGFTRAGNFKVDQAGTLVTSGGNPIIPAVALPGNRQGVSIGSTGEVSGQVDGEAVNAGQIQLASFGNPAGLSSAGGNILLQSNTSGPPTLSNPGAEGLGTIISGALETSNVDLTGEMVDQIVNKNAFKANANIIKAADEMTGTILDIKG